MLGQHKININEHKPSKFTELSNGYEMISNDATTKIVLRHVTVMNDSIEKGFYSTKLWIKEDNEWVETNEVQNFNTKEEFIERIEESEDFTEAIRDYKTREETWAENIL